MPSPSTPPPDSPQPHSRQARSSPRRVVDTQQRPAWIKRGAVALDAGTGQVGEVQHVGPLYGTGRTTMKDRETVWLRPCPGGGREWEATVADLSPAATRSSGAA